MTTIKYSKERIKSSLRMGLFFSAIGILLILLSFVIDGWENVSLGSIGLGQLSAGIFMFILYSYENKKQYLTLKDGELIKNSLFSKKIRLSEIKLIREFAGDLKLISDKGEFVINTQITDPNSLSELKNELKKHNIS